MEHVFLKKLQNLVLKVSSGWPIAMCCDCSLSSQKKKKNIHQQVGGPRDTTWRKRHWRFFRLRRCCFSSAGKATTNAQAQTKNRAQSPNPKTDTNQPTNQTNQSITDFQKIWCYWCQDSSMMPLLPICSSWTVRSASESVVHSDEIDSQPILMENREENKPPRGHKTMEKSPKVQQQQHPLRFFWRENFGRHPSLPTRLNINMV